MSSKAVQASDYFDEMPGEDVLLVAGKKNRDSTINKPISRISVEYSIGFLLTQLQNSENKKLAIGFLRRIYSWNLAFVVFNSLYAQFYYTEEIYSILYICIGLKNSTMLWRN